MYRLQGSEETMEYGRIVEGLFLSRPNRFVALVKVQGRTERVHVKNTGRCRELFTEGARVFLEEAPGSERKTKYDLVAVEKGGLMVNVDSSAPNKVAREWVESGALFGDVNKIRPETTYGSSRFDFYIETGGENLFLEVKGVTLQRHGVALFPDAPSLRAVRHVQELMQARAQGYGACVLFVIQMTGVSYFTPNTETHPAFGTVLRRAADEGVLVLACDCTVWEKGMCVRGPVEVRL